MAVETGVEPGRWTSTQRSIVGVAVVLGVAGRWWALGASGLTFDEAFTAAYARLPLGEIPSALRSADSHPPLDYLARHLFVGAHSEFVLRAPSAVFSTLALVLITIWMRRRSWFGGRRRGAVRPQPVPAAVRPRGPHVRVDDAAGRGRRHARGTLDGW